MTEKLNKNKHIKREYEIKLEQAIVDLYQERKIDKETMEKALKEIHQW